MTAQAQDALKIAEQHRDHYYALRDAAKKRKARIEARDYESMAIGCAHIVVALTGALSKGSQPTTPDMMIERARLIDELRGVKRAMEIVEFHAREPDLDLTPSTCRAIIKDALSALTTGSSAGDGYIGSASGPCNEGFRCVAYFDNPESAHALAAEIDGRFSPTEPEQ